MPATMYTVTDNDLTNIANAIRSKTGNVASLAFPADFIYDIQSIDTSGSDITVQPLSVSQNGTYTALTGTAYSPVSVNVPASAVDTGTKAITANGNGQDVVGYASVNVNVPNSYSLADNGKVVSNGALVAQTASTYTSNATYDTTLISSVTVNVAGGITPDQIALRTISQAIGSSANKIGSSAFCSCTQLTIASFPACVSIYNNAFDSCTALESISFPACTSLYNYAFRSCYALLEVNLPACSYVTTGAFQYCSALSVVSLPVCKSIWGVAFQRCYHLLSLYLMSNAVVSLSATTAFTSTPISNYTASTGGVQGSIYVPASLLNAYKTASFWSTFAARFVGV